MQAALFAAIRPRLATLLLAVAAFPACTPESISSEPGPAVASGSRAPSRQMVACPDCGTGFCGDGFCDEAAGESCDFCPDDCGTCAPPPP